MSGIFETERLAVRELSHADLDFVAEMLGDGDVMRYWPAPFDREGSRAWIDKQLNRYGDDGCGYWLAIERTRNVPVGQAGIMMCDINGVRRPALGYIMHRPFWRQGYALESARGCIEWTFANRDEDSVVAAIQSINMPSIRLAQKLEMTLEDGEATLNGLPHVLYASYRDSR